jgi:hypothetical protein
MEVWRIGNSLRLEVEFGAAVWTGILDWVSGDGDSLFEVRRI